MCHSLTNARNFLEMNPLFSGIYGEQNLSQTRFFSSPVCVGEETPCGKVHFSYSHNYFHFMLSRIKLEDKSSKISTGMFRRFKVVHFLSYKAPEFKETGSEVGDDFVFASFLKGSPALDKVAKAGVSHYKILDPSMGSSNFDVCQLFLRGLSGGAHAVEAKVRRFQGSPPREVLRRARPRQ